VTRGSSRFAEGEQGTKRSGVPQRGLDVPDSIPTTVEMAGPPGPAWMPWGRPEPMVRGSPHHNGQRATFHRAVTIEGRVVTQVIRWARGTRLSSVGAAASRGRSCVAGSHETGSAIVVASAGSSSGRRSCERSKTVGPMRSAIG